MNTKRFLLPISLLTAFTLWTALLYVVDVQPIGPEGTAVGFATLNSFVHNLTGVCMPVYTITDWLGLVPVFIGFAFAGLGLCQWIRRRHVLKVDFSILMLGVFYLLMLAVYLLFESVVVNYRPILIGGYREVSYPSSTTLLTLCVMPTTLWQLRRRIRNPLFYRVVQTVCVLFMVFMVGGRLLAGVHWLTDIIGGGLLSAGMVTLYDVVCRVKPGVS